MNHSDHSQDHGQRLLDLMKAEQIKHGRSEEEVDEGRVILRNKGTPAARIAASEFAELRLFVDMDDESPEIAGAALAGTPSDVTLAFAERDGYCPGCVRYWFGAYAEAFRTGMRE